MRFRSHARFKVMQKAPRNRGFFFICISNRVFFPSSAKSVGLHPRLPESAVRGHGRIMGKGTGWGSPFPDRDGNGTCRGRRSPASTSASNITDHVRLSAGSCLSEVFTTSVYRATRGTPMKLCASVREMHKGMGVPKTTLNPDLPVRFHPLRPLLNRRHFPCPGKLRNFLSLPGAMPDCL
jgi:hypothetical protein